MNSFRNRLCILQSLDFDELVAAGAMTDDADGDDEWVHFRKRPFDYFLSADDDVARAIWRAVEKRDNHEPLDPMRGVEFPFADNH